MRRIVGIGAILRPLPSFDESTLTIVASNDGKGEEIPHEAIDIHDLTCFATIKLVKILQMAKLWGTYCTSEIYKNINKGLRK